MNKRQATRTALTFRTNAACNCTKSICTLYSDEWSRSDAEMRENRVAHTLYKMRMGITGPSWVRRRVRATVHVKLLLIVLAWVRPGLLRISAPGVANTSGVLICYESNWQEQRSLYVIPHEK
jgi:hypothetical protein